MGRKHTATGFTFHDGGGTTVSAAHVSDMSLPGSDDENRTAPGTASGAGGSEDTPPVSAAPSFRRYPPRTEESGHVREYIADPGEHQYFELFIWLSGDTVARFDCHYDVQRDEHLLTWRAGDEQIHFLTVTPAKEKPIGMKKTQTLTETGRAELAGMRTAFAERVAATAAGPHADDAVLSRLLAFIGERLPGA